MSNLNKTYQDSSEFLIEKFLIDVFLPVVDDLVTQIESLRENINAEGVHEVRVAIRKIRSHLKTFKPLLKVKKYEAIDRDLRWLNSKISSLRDVDVMLDISKKLTLENQDSSLLIEHELELKRIAHVKALRHALDKNRVDGLLRKLAYLAEHPAMKRRLNESDALTHKALVLECVIASWNLLSNEITNLPRDPTPEQLHQVRIFSKRCRFAYEAAEMFKLLPATQVTTYARDLQRNLGQIHDTDMFMHWLKTKPQISTNDIELEKNELNLALPPLETQLNNSGAE